ncbi:hypothetical protein MMC27_002030 [Xylographa pallens]|nr:hypothetical protein [Xylographa pallens]
MPTGFAFATSHSTGIENIEVVTSWPGNVAGYREKVPSQIAYQAENNTLDEDTWGYAIPSNASKHCWTKLLLDQNARATEYDDPALRDMSEWRGLPLPRDKSAEDVVADYLSYLYQHCMECLERRMTQEVLKVTPIEFWFTMPALWSDEAQYTTKMAAERAGFGKNSIREHDKISMIREPEAAALSALKITADKYDDLLEINTGILICDGGGGTIDITSYTIVAITPTLKLEESCVGNGGKCGATYVDRNLEKLMAKRYGDHYTSLPVHKRGAGSPFMKAFEDIRNDFDGSNNRIAPLRLIMKNLVQGDRNCTQYDPDEAEITLTT